MKEHSDVYNWLQAMKGDSMEFNEVEEEVIFLKAIKELIDDMVNYDVLSLDGDPSDSEIHFRSSTHKQFFNIILVDFLSCTDDRLVGKKMTFLALLQGICDMPNFNQNNSIDSLRGATSEFIDWLETKITVKNIWFPSIDLETDLIIKRRDFIKICGNISKHNFSRLSIVVRDVKGIFKENGHDYCSEKILLVLGDFYEWFHEDIFLSYSSTIAELLNNIRWGIYEYLQPESHRFLPENYSDSYLYDYPESLESVFVKRCYWKLMNEISSEPCIHKFEVTRFEDEILEKGCFTES